MAFDFDPVTALQDIVRWVLLAPVARLDPGGVVQARYKGTTEVRDPKTGATKMIDRYGFEIPGTTSTL